MLETLSGDLFQKLKIFHYIMQYGSLAKAAAVIHKSPSSVSRQLQQLEDELGVTLLQRRSDGMLPTVKGHELYTHTLELFKNIETMLTAVSSPKTEMLSGTVKLIASPVAAETILPKIMPAIRQRWPEITLEITAPSGVSNVIKSLTTHSYHFALAAQIPNASAVSFLPLFHSPIWLVAPAGYELPEQVDSDPSLWKDLPLITMSDNVAITRFVDAFCAERSIQLNYRHLAPSLHCQLNMVEAGLGLAFADSTYLQCLGFPNLQKVVMPLIPDRVFGILQRSNAFQPPHVRAVIGLIQESFPANSVVHSIHCS